MLVRVAVTSHLVFDEVPFWKHTPKSR